MNALGERVRHDVTEQLEVTVELGMRPFLDNDLGRDELACDQIEGVRERHDAGVTEE